MPGLPIPIDLPPNLLFQMEGDRGIMPIGEDGKGAVCVSLSGGGEAGEAGNCLIG